MAWTSLGDSALFAPRPLGVGPEALRCALAACVGVTDVVVTEDVVCVHFDPRAPPGQLDEAITNAARSPAAGPPREVVVRAVYDGPDLGSVAARAGLSVQDVADLHAGAVYEVRMLGFVPGFAYLGGLPAALVMPRRASPRPRVPAGSIAIGAKYTGIYPFASPGGWHLLGRAPGFEAFSAEAGARLRLGDRVRFERVGGP